MLMKKQGTRFNQSNKNSLSEIAVNWQKSSRHKRTTLSDSRRSVSTLLEYFFNKIYG